MGIGVSRCLYRFVRKVQDMRELVARTMEVYERAGLRCGQGLLPPAVKEAVEEIGSELSLPIPEELRALYALHGGQDYIHPGTTGLFGAHRLYSPAEVLETHQISRENYLAAFAEPPIFPPQGDEDPGGWVVELIPFAGWDAYELCIHAHTGEVWEFEPSSGLIRYRPSIASVLEEVIASVEAGGEAELGAMR